jgi:hypothetical protein
MLAKHGLCRFKNACSKVQGLKPSLGHLKESKTITPRLSMRQFQSSNVLYRKYIFHDHTL